MFDRRDVVRLRHMLEAARKAVRAVAGKEREDLEADDDLLADALIRRVEIIGEAANKVSMETRSSVDTIPWADIVGMRNRLIHAYMDVDLDILWATIQDLPPLIEILEQGLAELSSELT